MTKSPRAHQPEASHIVNSRSPFSHSVSGQINALTNIIFPVFLLSSFFFVTFLGSDVLLMDFGHQRPKPATDQIKIHWIVMLHPLHPFDRVGLNRWCVGQDIGSEQRQKHLLSAGRWITWRLVKRALLRSTWLNQSVCFRSSITRIGSYVFLSQFMFHNPISARQARYFFVFYFTYFLIIFSNGFLHISKSFNRFPTLIWTCKTNANATEVKIIKKKQDGAKQAPEMPFLLSDLNNETSHNRCFDLQILNAHFGFAWSRARPT